MSILTIYYLNKEENNTEWLDNLINKLITKKLANKNLKIYHAKTN